jgi:magnesium chelatase subunit D
MAEASFTGYPFAGTGYPFAGIVGMTDLKLALLLNAVSPAIGGVLVRGEKGTAKSTVVRGLAALLPPVPVIAGCRYACDPASPDPSCPSGPHAPGFSVDLRPVTLAELPVGATEDRLVGSLDIEQVLTSGVTAFQPGLLASAHRGLLYVDEVNLLHDHLVDLLLDAAALGVNYVEREGVSVRHASRFLLVGTMNPEEGELRPQLLDRFGLTVQVAASRDPSERAEVVRRRLAFESSGAEFAARFAAETASLASQVTAAQSRLGSVVLPDAVLRQICAVCGAFGVDGMRADLVTARTAMALAAWHGRDVVTAEDVRMAARLALPHRRRRDPFDAPGLDEQALDEALRDSAPSDGPAPSDSRPSDRDSTPSDGTAPSDSRPSDRDSTPSDGRAPSGPASSGRAPSDRSPSDPDDPDPDPGPDGPRGGAPAPSTQGSSTSSSSSSSPSASSVPSATSAPPAKVAPPAAPFRARLLTVPGTGEGAPGRRSAARGPSGRTVGARLPAARPFPLHLPATIRAAALSPPHLINVPPRARHPDVPMAPSSPLERADGAIEPARSLAIAPKDLREAIREGREGNLVLFVVDASGSMAARERMRTVKGAILSLLLDAYQRRDKVGLVTFRGRAAELTLPPTSSIEAAARRLTTLPTGGRTPLAAGLAEGARVLANERLKDPRRRPLLVLVTDGRATAGTDADLVRAGAMLTGVASIVVDCEESVVRLGLASRLAVMLGGAPVFDLDDLRAAAGGPGQFNAAAGGPGQFNAAAGGPGQFNAAAGGPGQFNAAAGGPGQFNTAAGGPGQFNTARTRPNGRVA